MNYFGRRNVVITIIAVLLIINIATISTIVYHSYASRIFKDKKVSERTSFRVMRNELKLNPSQQKDFRRYGAKFRLDTKGLLDTMRILRSELIVEMSLENPDTIRMFEISDQIGLTHAALKKKTVKHFLTLKENCTPEQFKTLGSLFNHIVMEGEKEKSTGKNKRNNRRARGNMPNK